MSKQQTHSTLFGYHLWIFGFLGMHRFCSCRPISGTIYFFTLGLLFIGWAVDLFLIPKMDREADMLIADSASLSRRSFYTFAVPKSIIVIPQGYKFCLSRKADQLSLNLWPWRRPF